MKNLQHIAFVICIIVGTIITNAQNATMLILAPQNHDVISVSENITSIPVLLSVTEQIDSTLCEVSFNNNKLYMQKFWSVEDPYTLEIPVYLHQNVSIKVTTYYQGQIQKTEQIEIFFKQMTTQIGYVND